MTRSRMAGRLAALEARIIEPGNTARLIEVYEAIKAVTGSIYPDAPVTDEQRAAVMAATNCTAAEFDCVMAARQRIAAEMEEI